MVKVYPYLRRVIVLKRLHKGYMPKSIDSIYAFTYFAMQVVMMDFFKLWTNY
jgi:hypothetical protein